MPKSKNLLRIGQLAAKAGVSAPTIKYYVKEGLLPTPIKTSPNMAYYDESCVGRINLIKRIQKEKFLPLDVIKRLIDSGASYEEELQLGRAILKSHKAPVPQKSVRGSQVARATGYPLEKIEILENDGLIFPSIKNNVKYYDEIDCEIIELIKRREKLGLAFHHNLETVRIYRDTMAEAVHKDMRLFVENFLGDVSTQQAIKLLTEADDALDRFLVLFRYQQLRKFSQLALKEMNDMPAKLDTLNIFPLHSRELPQKPPKGNNLFKTIYHLCRGENDKLIDFIAGNYQSKADPDFSSLAILSGLLNSEPEAALKIVAQDMPRPTNRALDNTMAALAYLFSLREMSGLSRPMVACKKIIAYLKRNETAKEKNPLVTVCAQYVMGAVYTFLPDVIKLRSKGIAVLEELLHKIHRRSLKTGRLPPWLLHTLEFDIYPAIQIRANRFLAEAYAKQKRIDSALACLKCIIEMADPDSPNAEWAHMMRLKLK